MLRGFITKFLNIFDLQLIRKNTKGATFAGIDFLNVQKSDVILDIGCHLGSTIKEINDKWPDARIIGFEPYADFAQLCDERFAQNPLVEIKQVAISNSNGFANLTTSNFALSLHGNNLSTSDRGNAAIKVQTQELDAFVKKNKINKIKLIKIDVEGHELSVLKGMKNILTKQKVDVIVCEVMFMEHFKNQTLFLGLSNYLNEFGYEIFDLRQMKKNKINRLRFANCIYISSKIQKKLDDGMKVFE